MRSIKNGLSVVTLALMLVLAACGSGETDTAEPEAPAEEAIEETTEELAEEPEDEPAEEPEPQGTGAFSGDWCGEADNNEGFGVPDLASAADVEAKATEYLAFLDEAVDKAPGEIKADVLLIANTARSFFGLFAEYDYDFLSLPQDDPRLLAFDDPEIEAASNRIEEYCGWETNDPAAGSGIESEPVPEGFPDELLPPGSLVFTTDMGAAGVLFGTDAEYDDVVAYYEGLLGATASESGVGSVAIQATYNGTDYIVAVSEGDPVFVTVANF